MMMIYNNFDIFKKYDFFILIPSKGRPEMCKGTLNLFPDMSCLYVHESEADDYKKKNPNAVIVTHKRTKGYGSVINSAIKLAQRSGLKYMMVIDDDMTVVQSLVGNRQRNLKYEKRYMAVVNAVQVMEDIGCYLYLFSTCSNIIKYPQHLPYKVGFSLPQGVYVLNTKKIGIKYSENHHYYEDFDFCMKYLLRHRYYIIENRLLMTGTNVDSLTEGGCNSFRTQENEKESRKWIKDKWKSHVNFAKNVGGNIRPTCLVDRMARQ